MKINGKKVTGFKRETSKLLVCNLEGGAAFEFRGDAKYVDKVEKRLERGLAKGKRVAPLPTPVINFVRERQQRLAIGLHARDPHPFAINEEQENDVNEDQEDGDINDVRKNVAIDFNDEVDRYFHPLGRDSSDSEEDDDQAVSNVRPMPAPKLIFTRAARTQNQGVGNVQGQRAKTSQKRRLDRGVTSRKPTPVRASDGRLIAPLPIPKLTFKKR